MVPFVYVGEIGRVIRFEILQQCSIVYKRGKDFFAAYFDRSSSCKLTKSFS